MLKRQTMIPPVSTADPAAVITSSPALCLGSAATFRAEGDNTDSTVNHNKDSDLQKRMEKIANNSLSEYKDDIVPRTMPDGITGDEHPNTLFECKDYLKLHLSAIRISPRSIFTTENKNEEGK